MTVTYGADGISTIKTVRRVKHQLTGQIRSRPRYFALPKILAFLLLPAELLGFSIRAISEVGIKSGSGSSKASD